MESVTQLTLNLQQPNYAVVMHAVQNDRLTRKISATLVDGSYAWTPPSGSAAIVRFVKPDGTMGFYDVDEKNHTAVTWTGNVATIILAEQMLTVAGDVYCQLNFYNSGEERLSTFAWVIKVQKNVITDETIESTDYFNILTHQIDAIIEAVANVPTPYTSNPLMDGVASAGSSSKYARGDHRHPTDTVLQGAIDDLNGAINNFRPNQLKRKWIFIGDSYGHASGSNQGWIDKLVPMLGLSASDYYESAAGGYSFAGSYTFLSLLTTLTGNITDKTDITDIVVLGGANDVGVTAEAISTAIETFNTYAYTNYPNAVVRIGMIGACSDASKVAQQYSRAKEGYANCGKAQYLNNLEYVFQNRSYVSSDTIHPTSTGYEVLTKKIYEALNGGCNVIYREFETPTYPTGFNAITGASTYNVIVNNEITTITIPQRTGKIAANSDNYFAVQAGTPIAVCNLPTKLILTGAMDQHTVLATTTIATIMSKVNDNFYQIKGSMFIAGNDRTVYFIPQDIVLGTTSAFNSCDRISIDAVAFTAPSIMV